MNLSELIGHHKGDRSFDDLEEASGGTITSQRLQQIATTVPATFPLPKGIRAIARALGVKESVVVLAAAESLGLDAELPRISEVLSAAASNLSDEEVAAVAHMIRAFKREEVMGNAEHPAPTKLPAPREIEAPAKQAARRGGLTKKERAEAEEAGRRRRPAPRPPNDEKTLTDEDTA